MHFIVFCVKQIFTFLIVLYFLLFGRRIFLKEPLISYFDSYVEDGICIAFSGGVDSSLLLKAACCAVSESSFSHKKPVLAVTFETKLHPHTDTLDAANQAQQFGALHHIVKIDEFSNPEITKNPVNRCYLCKHFLFETLKKEAVRLGYRYLFDGSNLDDTKVYRPGLAALKELKIESPLITLGFTKEMVRQAAAEFGLSTSSKPSTPCMATRLPYGTPFDYELLDRLHRGESFLRNLGFYNVRLRCHDNLIRIEVDQSDLSKILEYRKDICDCLKSLGFQYLTLDLEGFRSGSMDHNLTHSLK